MTKTILCTVIMAAVLCPSDADSQEAVDSVRELNEIVVKAPKVVRKADMDVYYPSRSAVSSSRNGIQLLSSLMIPSLAVAEAFGSVKAAGEAVQLRVNGRVATVDQVRALLPETVKRVEWIDNPGLCYDGANYVLNFVVANPALGGSLQTEGRQALNVAWGDYFADCKFNNGPSQFEVEGVFKLTDRLRAHREYKETFVYPDGKSLTRTETPLGGHVDNTFGRISGSYSYIRPDTTTVYLGVSVDPSAPDYWVSSGLLSFGDGSDDIILTDSHGSQGTTPKFSAYIGHHLANGQTIVADFNSSFYFGKSYSDYIERLPGHSSNRTEIRTMIKDRNQAYGAEANYIKKWNNSRLTAGVSYTANRNRSVYENLGGKIFHQRQDKVYFFSEYFRRINKVTFTTGIGAQYTGYMFKETGQGNHSWNIRPQATLTYRFNQKHNFRLSFQSWQTAPSLAESNVTPQQIDGFQWRMGNPDLKTSSSYMLSLRYSFELPRVVGSFGVRAFTSPDAIAPYLYWDANRLVTSFENSRGLHNLTFFLSPQIEIVPGWLMASGHLQYRVERMKGTGYKLHNHNWSGNIDIMLTHWGFELMGHYERAQRDLWGEKISWGESLSVVQLTYNWENWQFGVGVIMPFGKYDQGSKMLSRWNTNEQHMRLDMRMPYIALGYSLQWGRQKRGADKLIDAEASPDRSTAGGR